MPQLLPVFLPFDGAKLLSKNHNNIAQYRPIKHKRIISKQELEQFIFILFTRHSLVERRARCLFVCLFGQRFLSNPRADSRHILHVGVAWVGTCLLPFWGLAAPGGRKKGQMKFSLLWESTGNFCILAVFELARIHTKYYLCTDNVCRRAPSPCGIHRPLGGGGRGS